MASSEVGALPAVPRIMVHALAANWWLIFLRGLCAVLFGVLAFIWPGVTLVTLVLLYGAYALADGILALIAAVKGGAPAPRWWLALVGLAGVGAGILSFMWPGMTALILLFFIAGWAIAAGIMEIIGAIKLRKEITGEWFLIASGILSVIIGIGFFLMPGAGALALVIVIGAYAVVHGVLLLSLALRLRRHTHAAH
jgi:uncharacterized membrane protein HdeD (DUF308 family)